MKASTLIENLLDLIENHGDLEVKITEGFEGEFYEGDFPVEFFEDTNDKFFDIGIGGFNSRFNDSEEMKND